MRSVIAFAVVALVAAGTIPRLYTRTHDGAAASINLAQAAPPAETTNANSRSMTIRRGDNGHFNVEGSIDGRHMEFLIDTGASVIALRERDAASLGIHPSERDYSALVSTANGTVRAARIELNRVEIGPLTVYNVAALVLPDEALGQNLLGMSFLSRVRWEQQNGQLVLAQ
ncbi:MAG TPA: TIGR02281 family clan AA aspartic protease [Xanthobacteraceae bacterium]|nr:TIGR02281 family clan AA aspartic protease [Xanthobacteraceae bacterium]